MPPHPLTCCGRFVEVSIFYNNQVVYCEMQTQSASIIRNDKSPCALTDADNRGYYSSLRIFPNVSYLTSRTHVNGEPSLDLVLSAIDLGWNGSVWKPKVIESPLHTSLHRLTLEQWRMNGDDPRSPAWTWDTDYNLRTTEKPVKRGIVSFGWQHAPSSRSRHAPLRWRSIQFLRRVLRWLTRCGNRSRIGWN